MQRCWSGARRVQAGRCLDMDWWILYHNLPPKTCLLKAPTNIITLWGPAKSWRKSRAEVSPTSMSPFFRFPQRGWQLLCLQTWKVISSDNLSTKTFIYLTITTRVFHNLHLSYDCDIYIDIFWQYINQDFYIKLILKLPEFSTIYTFLMIVIYT